MVWAQQAYLTASYTGSFDYFGNVLAISANGDRIIVGANAEDSNAQGVNGDASNNSLPSAGAAYVYHRSGSAWTQEAYLKPCYGTMYYFAPGLGNYGFAFATSVAMSSDGATVIAATPYWDGNLNFGRGAATVFSRTGTTWASQSFLTSSIVDYGDQFAWATTISGDGNTIACAIPYEESKATGVNGNEADNTSASSGAVYVFAKSGITWNKQAYIKASNTGEADILGGINVAAPYSNPTTISLSENGNVLAVSAIGEDSKATGIDGDQWDNSSSSSGAVYLFTRSGTTWSQQAYIKASNTGADDMFGASLSLSGDGNTLVVGAPYEDGGAVGINGNQWTNTSASSGAVYVFTSSGGIWSQTAYVKAFNNNANDIFGICVSANSDGTKFVVGAHLEDNANGGVDPADGNALSAAGAAYLFELTGSSWSQTAYIKATTPPPAQDDYFGWSVGLAKENNTLVVGAWHESSVTGVTNGGVYVYAGTGWDAVTGSEEEPEEEETTTVSSLERKPQKEKSKTKKLISSKEFADIFEREKKQKEQQRFTNLLINNEDWIRRKENLTYTLGDYLFVPIETNYFDIGEKEIFQQRVQEAIYTVYTRILDFLNKQRNDELAFKYFKYVDYHLDFYPGAKLKFLIAIEKKDLEVFKEKEKKKTATVINLKAGEVLNKLDMKKLQIYNSSFGTIIKNGK